MAKTPISLPTVYLSFDVETDGPSPILNNLLSIGIYGLDKDFKNIFNFSENIFEHLGKVQNKDTMIFFWNKEENQTTWRNLKKFS